MQHSRTNADVGDAIADALAAKEPAHAAAYADGAARFRATMLALDREYAAGLARCSERELVTSHADFSYLAERYDSHLAEWDGPAQKTAMSTATGVQGGYTVPTEFYEQLMQIIAEQSFIRPRAFVQPMGSATLQIPFLDVSTVQAAGVSVFGVSVFSWARAVSAPTSRREARSPPK